MLIDTFVNAIYLYDDKMVLTFNYKDVTKDITFDDIKGSDLDCPGAPALLIRKSKIGKKKEGAKTAIPVSYVCIGT